MSRKLEEKNNSRTKRGAKILEIARQGEKNEYDQKIGHHMILRLKQALGYIFLLIGVAGVFLPLMPGTIFIILGIGLLGSEHKLVVKIKNLIGHRFQPPKKDEKKKDGLSTVNERNSS